MGNLTRYTLSWLSFLVSLCILSGPVSALIISASSTQSGKVLISAIVLGGVLPFGYMFNLVPLLAFRFFKFVGIFNRLNGCTDSKVLVTDEMRSQHRILLERLKSLSDCEQVIREARLARSDKWAHLIIHYNLICTLIGSVIVGILVAVLSKDWSLGLLGMLDEKPGSLVYLAIFGVLAILVMILAITAIQTRWELICAYQIELERLDEIRRASANNVSNRQTPAAK